MKSDRVIKLSLTAVAAALAILVTGCYYMPGANGGTAKVAVGVKGVPVNLVSAALVVTAPGMAPITATAALTSNSITVSVPAGPARTFTLLLNGPSATLQGVATVDLQAGESTTINVTPTLGATQIVVPDLLNNRVVQISDMNGTGWTAIAGAAGLPSGVNPTGASITPYALDFDSLGRIYIASQSAIGLFRIDDISHVSTSAVSVDTLTGVTSVAVDRTNGLIYYGTGSTAINQKAVNNIAGGAASLSLTAENSNIFASAGLASDDQGILYLAVDTLLTYTWEIIKYNPMLPSGSRIVATSANNILSSPWGIMVKGPYVYVSDSGAGKIDRFDKNLQYIDSFSGPANSPFTRPETFLATLNQQITVMDEGSGVDRITSFGDITGAGWTTFGSTGAGTNQFELYSIC